MDFKRGRSGETYDSMKSTEILSRALSEKEYALWNTLVEKSPQGSIFSSSGYLQILADAMESRLEIIGCFIDSDLVGGCPLLISSRRFFGHTSVTSGPNTPFTGFIFKKTNEDSVRKREMGYNACVNSLCDYIKTEKYPSVSITNSPDLLDIRPFLWRGWKGFVSYAYYINLNNMSIDKFSSSVKRSIKKAQNSNQYVEKSIDTCAHYRVITKVFERQSITPPFNELYLKKILNYVKITKAGDMWVIKDQSGEIIASRIWLWDNKRAYAWSAASTPEYRDSGANQLLFYTVLEELKMMGIRQINIMHANTPRLAGFASGFNPYLVPYYTVQNYRGIFRIFNAAHSIVR